MAGISTTLLKEDLQFMAEDISRELMAFLPPAERLAGISVDERLAGISADDRLAGISTDERPAGISVDELRKAIDAGALLHELSPDHRKVLLELLATMQATNRKEKKNATAVVAHPDYCNKKACWYLMVKSSPLRHAPAERPCADLRHRSVGPGVARYQSDCFLPAPFRRSPASAPDSS